MTGFVRDSVGLTLVLGNIGVDQFDNVRADGGLENRGKFDSDTRLGSVD